MPEFSIVSSYGSESESTLLQYPSGDWNLFIIGDSLYIKNITTDSTPVVIATNILKYTASKISTYAYIPIYVLSSTNVLKKILIDVTTSVSQLYSTEIIQQNIIGIDSVSINDYLRLVYVTESNDMIINDFIDPLEQIPLESFTIPLDDNGLIYLYHLINQDNLEEIIVYYVDPLNELNITEVTYVILVNIIYITPSTGDKRTVFSVDLSDVDLDYSNLTITSNVPSDLITIIEVNETEKYIRFSIDSDINGTRIISASDGVDSFQITLFYDKNTKKRNLDLLPAIAKPTSYYGIRAPGVAIKLYDE